MKTIRIFTQNFDLVIYSVGSDYYAKVTYFKGVNLYAKRLSQSQLGQIAEFIKGKKFRSYLHRALCARQLGEYERDRVYWMLQKKFGTNDTLDVLQAISLKTYNKEMWQQAHDRLFIASKAFHDAEYKYKAELDSWARGCHCGQDPRPKNWAIIEKTAAECESALIQYSAALVLIGKEPLESTKPTQNIRYDHAAVMRLSGAGVPLSMINAG